jgi:hypothetical protein
MRIFDLNSWMSKDPLVVLAEFDLVVTVESIVYHSIGLKIIL